jgi:hypothetical protein
VRESYSFGFGPSNSTPPADTGWHGGTGVGGTLDPWEK